MTTNEMLSLLGYRLEDTSQDQFDQTIKLLMLNRAQDTVVSLLHKHLLHELDGTKTDTLDGDGAYDFSSLNIFQGEHGIYALMMDLTVDKYSSLISFEEYQDHVNKVRVFHSSKHRHYILGTKLYCLFPNSTDDVPSGSILAGTKYKVIDYTSITYNSTVYNTDDTFTGVSGVTTYSTNGSGKVIVATDIKLHYLKSPTKLTTNDNSDLNAAYHDAITLLAEGECWQMVQKHERSKKAMSKGMAYIENYNTKSLPTESTSYEDTYEPPLDTGLGNTIIVQGT